MVNYTRIFSIEDAEAVCRRDVPAGTIGPFVDEFINKNKHGVYHAVNTWCALAHDIGVPDGLLYALKTVIKSIGLAKTVGNCRGCADEVLDGVSQACPELRGSFTWQSSHVHGYTDPIYQILDYIQEEIADDLTDCAAMMLQFLLYLERFTYIIRGTTGVQASIDKFLAVNRDCREMEYDWSVRPGVTILSMLGDALAEIVTQKDWNPDPWDNGFSSGSVIEAMVAKGPRAFKKSTLGKWVSLSHYRACYMHPMYPLPDGCNAYRRFREPVMTLVPKTFDARRVIFPEDTVMSYYAHGVLETYRRMLDLNGTSPFINEEDQSVNRALSRVGSTDGTWATIDMSSASDSISKALAFWVLPEWFRPIMLSVNSFYFSEGLPGQKGQIVRKLFTLLTSGNPMTWLFESTWFLAVGRVAASLCGDQHPELAVFVYGDDMVVRSDYYETTCELLACLGHRVNTRKSYGTGRFRESCGGWYHNGTDITPLFWPRREFPVNHIEAYPVLVDLQHKMVAGGYMSASDYLVDEISARYPDVTRSSLFSIYDDIWDPSIDPYVDSFTRHVYLSPKREKAPAECRALAEVVAYVDYLGRGPLYDSELDRLLGTSSSRYQRLVTIPTGEFRWTVR